MRTPRTIWMLAVALAIAGCGKEDGGSGPQKPAAVTPEVATPVEPPGERLGKEIRYKAGDVELVGYLASDPSVQGKRPGILVVHEWWGLNDYTRRRADMLAKMGYTALAIDMFGGGKVATHPEDAGKFTAEVTANMDVARARFEAGLQLLRSQDTTDPDKVAAIGYCFGGGIVLNMARAGLDLDGVASFHGMLGTKTPAKKGQIKAKILVLHGDDDSFVPAEQVAGFKKEMADAGADMKFVGYPGAKHAFTNPEASENGKKFKLPLAYDKEADEKSWAELDQFLRALFPN